MRSRSRLRHYSEPFIRTSEVAIVYWCATGLEVISGIRLAAAHVHRNGCPRGAEISLSGIGIPTRRITAKRDCVPHPLNSLWPPRKPQPQVAGRAMRLARVLKWLTPQNSNAGLYAGRYQRFNRSPISGIESRGRLI
jgi:hypothetical protein